MTRAQSMEVINDSTTMQSRIDAVLAAPIMDWDHSPEIQWQPGDPLWKHPDERNDEVIDFASPALEMPHGRYYSRPERGGGNCPRHMLEIVGLEDYFTGNDEFGNAQYQTIFEPDDTLNGSSFLVDCDDCLIGIGNDETNCWNCGKRVLMTSKNEQRSESEKYQAAFYRSAMASLLHPMVLRGDDFDGDSRLIFSTPMQNGSSEMRGLRSLLTEVDEVSDWTFPLSSRAVEFVEYTELDARFTEAWMRLNPGPVESEVPDVPILTLRDTDPDLYRPGYERHFEDRIYPTTAERHTHE